jgi:transcriptional regulator NrdR family protein
MRCRKCGYRKSIIKDSRIVNVQDPRIYSHRAIKYTLTLGPLFSVYRARRRYCPECGEDWLTMEICADELEHIVDTQKPTGLIKE